MSWATYKFLRTLASEFAEGLRSSKVQILNRMNDKEKQNSFNFFENKLDKQMDDQEECPFMELDLREKPSELPEKEEKPKLSSEFKINLSIPPLFVSTAFKAATQENQKSAILPDLKNSKAGEKTKKIKMACFLLEKLEFQAKNKSSVNKETGPVEKNIQKSSEFLEKEYLQLENEHNILEIQRDELSQKLEEALSELKKAKSQIKILTDSNVVIQAQLNKKNVERELVNLYREGNGGFRLDPVKKATVDQFSHVLQFQMAYSKKAKLVAKYAYKWYFKSKAAKFRS